MAVKKVVKEMEDGGDFVSKPGSVDLWGGGALEVMNSPSLEAFKPRLGSQPLTKEEYSL